jgi:CHAT domain-containing protein/Tfp pilus assembly protein PilF
MAKLLQCIAGLLVAIVIGMPAPASAQRDPATAFDAKITELYRAGKFSEAMPLAQRALAMREKALGPDSQSVGTTLNIISYLYRSQGLYNEAMAPAQRALAIREKGLGPDNPSIAESVAVLGLLYEIQSRYSDAEPLYKRALAIYEKALGPDHAYVAQAVSNLGHLYFIEGHFADAEPLYQRALAIYEKTLPDDPQLAEALSHLAELYRSRERYADAEPLLQRALAIYEKARGPDHPYVAEALNDLANLYRGEDRYADAEQLYQRALAIRQKTYGPDHPDVAGSLNSLGNLYRDQHRYADAEASFKRSVAIFEKVFGPDHPEVAIPAYNLANVYRDQRRFADAEPLFKRSLAIYEKAFGPDSPAVANALNDLANVYEDQKRFTDAEPLYQRALAIREKALGPDHPDVAQSLNNLANLYEDETRFADALPLAERVIASGRAKPGVALPLLFGASRANVMSADKALDDSLNVVQHATQTSAASAISKLAIRLAAGSDRLSQLVRQDQDLAAESETLEKSIISAVSKAPAQRDPAVEQRTKARIAAIADQREALKKVFGSEFPDYSALSNPAPMTAKEIQALLADDEALVLFAAAVDEVSYVFALTRTGSDWKSIPLGGDALAEKVATFRHGLDVDMVADQDYFDANKIKRELFDLGFANELYATLIGPVEPLIKNKKHLIVVPFGPLTALPFHLLVTEKPAVAKPTVDVKVTAENMASYRDAAWLTKSQAVSVMPSLASLKALRLFGRKEQGSKPIIGFGNPVFSPGAAAATDQRGARKTAARGIATRSLATRSFTDFWQGVGVDRRLLGQALPQLPDTADELKAVAQELGAPLADIHLGRDASESTVKRAPLADYRIVYFATHGLVAGDIKGLAEPSLALTIPPQPSDVDDGLLTASEVAQLKLNADWVVLSACNTIAGDKPGAEALSGLARAFFYAGARALLVSHWAVASDAATRVTIATFDVLKADPKLGRAEAMRRAMLAYLNDPAQPRNAYPAIWGPFSIVGEGAAR